MAVDFPQFKVSASSTPFDTDGIEAVTFDAQVADGREILVGISLNSHSRTITSVVDDGGNTYALASQGGIDATNEITDVELWVYRATVATPASTVTVTLSSPLASEANLWVLEVSGQHATPIEDVALADTVNVQTHPVGPVTTAGGGSGLVGLLATAVSTLTNEGGWTQLVNFSGTFFSVLAAYRTIGAGSTSWSPTTVGTDDCTLALMAIAPSAGGAGGDMSVSLHEPIIGGSVF